MPSFFHKKTEFLKLLSDTLADLRGKIKSNFLTFEGKWKIFTEHQTEKMRAGSHFHRENTQKTRNLLKRASIEGAERIRM